MSRNNMNALLPSVEYFRKWQTAQPAPTHTHIKRSTVILSMEVVKTSLYIRLPELFSISEVR